METNYEKHKKVIINILYIALIIGAFYFGFVKVIPLISPFVIALLFAIIISPLANFFVDKLKFNRRFASFFVILLIFAVLASLISLIVNQLYSLGESILTKVLSSADVKGLIIISEEIAKLTGKEVDLVSSFKNLIVPLAQALISFAKTFVSSVPRAFLSSVVFILATYFMVADKDKLLGFIYKIIGEKNEVWIKEIKRISRTSIGKYIKAQLIIMSITFSELLVGFFIIKILKISDINYLFLIAIGIALLDSLPIFGTGTVLIPWCLYEIVVANFGFATALLLLYIICLVVRQLIEPKIVGQSLGLHPLVTLFAMYLGYKLLGIGGMILLPICTLFVVQFYRIGAFKNLKNIFN